MLAGTEGADCDLNLIIVRARLELIETQDGEAPMEHGLFLRVDSDNSFIERLSYLEGVMRDHAYAVQKPFVERRRCFNCDTIGHVSRDCPNRVGGGGRGRGRGSGGRGSGRGGDEEMPLMIILFYPTINRVHVEKMTPAFCLKRSFILGTTTIFKIFEVYLALTALE